MLNFPKVGGAFAPHPLFPGLCPQATRNTFLPSPFYYIQVPTVFHFEPSRLVRCAVDSIHAELIPIPLEISGTDSDSDSSGEKAKRNRFRFRFR